MKTIYAVLASTFVLNIGGRFVGTASYYGVRTFVLLRYCRRCLVLENVPPSKVWSKCAVWLRFDRVRSERE